MRNEITAGHIGGTSVALYIDEDVISQQGSNPKNRLGTCADTSRVGRPHNSLDRRLLSHGAFQALHQPFRQFYRLKPYRTVLFETPLMRTATWNSSSNRSGRL